MKRALRSGHLWRLVACAAALCAGCLDTPEGVIVHLTLPEDEGIDRVRVSGVADRDEAFEPAFFPDPPRLLDAQGETLTVLIDEELIGEDLVLSFEAQRGTDVRARGSGTVDVPRDRLVDLDVDLSGGGGRAAGTSTGTFAADAHGAGPGAPEPDNDPEKRRDHDDDSDDDGFDDEDGFDDASDDGEFDDGDLRGCQERARLDGGARACR